MPSKKRKYNARFPAGRIKKIMQTDEEVGKVAKAVPIIISIPRTLELFVESLLNKALQVTNSRNAKTLTPSHVKQCILAESKFDFLRDLVNNIPDVSVAEEKEIFSEESSPNTSRFLDMAVSQNVIKREDSNSSNSSDIRLAHVIQPPKEIKLNTELDFSKPHRTEPTSTIVSNDDLIIDLSKKTTEAPKPRTANFYQETLLDPEQRSVIKINPIYAVPQPSTSSYVNQPPIAHVQKIETIPKLNINLRQNNIDSGSRIGTSISAPVTPILNIDFSKNLTKPEIKMIDTTVGDLKDDAVKNSYKLLHRQNSKSLKQTDVRKVVTKISVAHSTPINVDNLNSDNLEIDEDYDT